jgi:hypothetical protein
MIENIENRQSYQELRTMLTQLTQRLGLSNNESSQLQSTQQPQNIVESRNLPPVKTRKRIRKLSPMSRSLKKTLHVSYISLSFCLIS